MQTLSLYSHTPDDAISRLWQTEEVFPTQADVVVLGGGIVGATSAYYLAGMGLKVVLVEKNKVASQQSGRNWGFVRTQYRDLAEMPLALEALSIWPGLERELGRDIGWRRSGCVFVAKDDAECEAFGNWHASAVSMSPDARMLTGAQVAALLPAFTPRVPGALYTATDGQAEPAMATIAFARAAVGRGARVLEDCGAIEIETTAGAVSGVLTEHGLIRTSAVVCAAGATSHRFLSKFGLMLPQQVVRNTVSLTRPLPLLSESCFCGLGLGLRQRPDGSCILAAESTSDIDFTLDTMRAAKFFLPAFIRNRKTFALQFGNAFLHDIQSRLSLPRRERTIEPRRPRIPPNTRRADKIADLFNQMFGGKHAVSVVKSWAGNIDVLPDALPVIDCPPQVPGLVVATGFSGHGFGLGPAVGRNVARLVSGARSAVSLDPFKLERFALGTYARPHAPL